MLSWFRRKSPLQLALERGLKTDGDIATELRELGDEFTVATAADANAVCDSLETILQGNLPRSDRTFRSPFQTVAMLFQKISSENAFRTLMERGNSILQSAVNGAFPLSLTKEEILLCLKLLGMFPSRSGTDLIVTRARSGFASEDYPWSVILSTFDHDHPETPRLLAALSDPLPSNFIAVSLLDAANQFLLKGGQAPHPFDSAAGIAQLRRWLEDTDPEHFSYAISGIAALPFIERPEHESLLRLALQHPDPHARLQAAWAAGKLGHSEGFDQLAQACLDIHLANRASDYLKELGREDLVPAAMNDPEFLAKAEFSQWLAHPHELGRTPDEITVVDTRILRWPPDFATERFWLLQYRARNTDPDATKLDDVGIGLVGSVTWCFFSRNLEQRPAEDAYSLHASWEMEHAEKLMIAEVGEDGDRHDYDHLLQEWAGSPLNDPKIVRVAELSPEVRYPQRLVAIATAELNGANGWVVLDGPRSLWYPANHFPKDERPNEVLSIHIGRQLLGLPLEANDRLARLAEASKLGT